MWAQKREQNENKNEKFILYIYEEWHKLIMSYTHKYTIYMHTDTKSNTQTQTRAYDTIWLKSLESSKGVLWWIHTYAVIVIMTLFFWTRRVLSNSLLLLFFAHSVTSSLYFAGYFDIGRNISCLSNSTSCCVCVLWNVGYSIHDKRLHLAIVQFHIHFEH